MRWRKPLKRALIGRNDLRAGKFKKGAETRHLKGDRVFHVHKVSI